MSNSKPSSVMTLAGALLVVAVMVFTGCSKSPVDSVLSTVDEPSQPQLLGRTSAAMADLGVATSMHAEQWVSGADGGQIQLYDVILDIPAGALKTDTLYSIDIPDPNVFFNEFGTDGLVFDIPVTVTMSYRDADLSGVDESTIRIGWWDESAGEWVDMDCQIDFVNQTVTGKLYHFSAYALVSD